MVLSAATLFRSPQYTDFSPLYFSQVSYKFSSLALLTEPFLLIVTFFLFFLTAIISVRLDLTIATKTPAYLAKIQQEEVRDNSTVMTLAVPR